tara:strand:+ start:72 stop:245 length:174 start_codon:yes stop_codon:yes gene_type:complete
MSDKNGNILIRNFTEEMHRKLRIYSATTGLSQPNAIDKALDVALNEVAPESKKGTKD